MGSHRCGFCFRVVLHGCLNRPTCAGDVPNCYTRSPSSFALSATTVCLRIKPHSGWFLSSRRRPAPQEPPGAGRPVHGTEIRSTCSHEAAARCRLHRPGSTGFPCSAVAGRASPCLSLTPTCDTHVFVALISSSASRTECALQPDGELLPCRGRPYHPQAPAASVPGLLCASAVKHTASCPCCRPLP